jgi:hypothetical protein
LHPDQTLAVHWPDVSTDLLFPIRQPLEMKFDTLKIGVLLLELLKRKALVKVIDITALFEFIHCALEPLKVLDDAPLDGCLRMLICT